MTTICLADYLRDLATDAAWRPVTDPKRLALMLSLIAASEAEQRAAKIETTTEEPKS